MTLVLVVATWLGLDRPYWALISAVFLQIRPEAGMVIEKGMAQIFGTLLGSAVGIGLLYALPDQPRLIVGLLGVWIGAMAFASAFIRRMNVVYGFSIAGITAALVVMLPLAIAGSSDTAIAATRASEILLGAGCATLVASLFWRQRVADLIVSQSRSLLNQTMDYMMLELDADSLPEPRRAAADGVLQSAVTLNDDGGAALFEGTRGPGRLRAVSRLGQAVLSLLAMVQVFGRFRRVHPELIGPRLDDVLERVAGGLESIRDTGSLRHARSIAQELRRQIQKAPTDSAAITPLQQRLLIMVYEMVGELAVALRAYQALETPDRTLLKAPRLASYGDPLLGAIRALRTMAVFAVGAAVWLTTGSAVAVVFMILPVIFSIMLARMPSPPRLLRRALVGTLVAVPLAWATANFLVWLAPGLPLLVVVTVVPLFAGLLLLASPTTRFYGLGFIITFILLVQPGISMTFSLPRFAVLSGALIIAIALIAVLFSLINSPGARLIQRRLIARIGDDLRRMGTTYPRIGEAWFNARMAERLLRLATYDRRLDENDRHLTDLGLTGLNIGHTALRVQRQLGDIADHGVRRGLSRWHHALADAYERAGQGKRGREFRDAGSALLAALASADELDASRAERLEGMMERLALTFERLAASAAAARPRGTP